MSLEALAVGDRQWVPLHRWHAPENILSAYKAAVEDLIEGVCDARPPPAGVDRLLRHMPQAPGHWNSLGMARRSPLSRGCCCFERACAWRARRVASRHTLLPEAMPCSVRVSTIF